MNTETWPAELNARIISVEDAAFFSWMRNALADATATYAHGQGTEPFFSGKAVSRSAWHCTASALKLEKLFRDATDV